jgi:hypothetical protein
MSTLHEPLLTPLSHFHKRTPMLPLFVSPSHPSSTLPPCNPSTAKPPSLVLDLSPLPPPLLTSPLCSGSLGSTLQPHLPLTDSALPIKPLKRLLFRSPLPEGEAMKQARSWHRDQLLDLRCLWELRRQHQISARLLPMTQPPTMISDTVLGVGSKENIVMAIPLSSQTVTRRWHVRLDVSKVRSVANSSQESVLIADPKPLLT